MQFKMPPLEIQREIVSRIETERAIVHGNRELILLLLLPQTSALREKTTIGKL